MKKIFERICKSVESFLDRAAGTCPDCKSTEKETSVGPADDSVWYRCKKCGTKYPGPPLSIYTLTNTNLGER